MRYAQSLILQGTLLKFILLFIVFISLSATDLSDYINKKKCDQIIDKKVYTICYDYMEKGALYVSYTLNGELVNKENIKRRYSFYTEKNLPKNYRSQSRDYSHSGYDRGHLASDASFDYNEKTLRKTYSMANVIPQVKYFLCCKICSLYMNSTFFSH